MKTKHYNNVYIVKCACCCVFKPFKHIKGYKSVVNTKTSDENDSFTFS